MPNMPMPDDLTKLPDDYFRVTKSESRDQWSEWWCTDCMEHNSYPASTRAAQHGARRHTIAAGHRTEVTFTRSITYTKKET